ncbi:uncharacterized protein LAESUDRAFT_811853 [Laetiporus sulphureus 93-53]|uniref:Post-SET domain-containing protein n=1 Tax=Laetiporus sulphureus 93-53 TaxID=1314785 RepID=A0A165EQZ7_9APHY|nr:uncharacterized protein LAESUDRAFT_811853 [Laetiporus sulphureus 93-53]KZT07583.1 hypothetical protein LAESUDRAFT_811853 [Laetiporus sulphureus 93-53]
MADGSLQSIASTLAGQSMTLSQATQHDHNVQVGTNDPVPGQPMQMPNQNAVAVPPNVVSGAPINVAPMPMNQDGTNPEVPLKRKPGRPKGSGKKQLDMNAEPKIKRPVGRPRKDGLPAGSVGPRRASRPRKRPPGTFASGAQSVSAAAVFSYGYNNFMPGPSDPWRASAPPMGSLPRSGRPSFMFPIDPSLDRDNWADVARTRPDAFLQLLVSALAAPNPVSAAGPSVEEAFKSHLASLAPASKNIPSIPTLYSILKTFWLPSSPVYFSLTASASTARIPSEHRFLYWDPQPLVFNGIACPACSAPLINRGRIMSGPIKVYDLGKPFFIIGCEYVCRSPMCANPQSAPEGRKFASTDISILRSLPPKLRDEFPALLIQGNPDLGSGPDVWNWHGMGVSIALWNMVRASLKAGLTKEAIMDIIKSIQSGLIEDEVMPMPPPPQEQQDGSADQEEEEDDENQDAAQVEGSLEYPKDRSAEEFHEAWNAHSAAADPSGGMQEPQAGPSNAVDVNGQAAHQHPNPNPNPASPDPGSISRAGQFPMFAPYSPYQYANPYFYPSPPIDPNANQNILKRTFSIVDSSAEAGSLTEPAQKRIRHCCKCGSNECKGKGGRAFCTNPCQDCGKLDCKGRNSKRPDRTCSDAWP